MIVLFANCKKDRVEPQVTEEERVTNLLTAGGSSWTPMPTNGILLDGVDVSEELFDGFTIQFSTNQITTTGSTPVWLRQDTWQFKSGSTSIIIRGQDSKEVTIESVSETELRLTLDWEQTTYEGGRANSLPGRYQFVMNK